MSKFFEELEAQLHAAARAQTGEEPPITEQSRPRHGWLRSWGRAVPVALAVAVTAAVVVVALTVQGRRAPHAPSTSAAAAGSAPKRPPAAGATETIPSGASVGGMQVVGTLGHLSAEQQHELSAYIERAQCAADIPNVDVLHLCRIEGCCRVRNARQIRSGCRSAQYPERR